MQRTVNTKFFHVRQNNSGGYFINNDEVAAHLIIEARNAAEAESRMHEITAPFSEYCPCCGERWYLSEDDDDGTDMPTIYGKPAEEYEDWFASSAVIHYYDGSKRKFHTKERR